MRFFNIDSPLMQGLSKMADLMWLNILAFICCIPIFTAGASFTALHYMALKIVRGEETYITKGFFKSFKENFKQATLIWLLLVLVLIILAGDFYIINNSGLEFGNVIKILITIVGIMVLFTANYVFAVLAKFENSVFRTIKNAFLMSIAQFPKTILMFVLYLLPIILFAISLRLIPIAFLFGLSVPVYLSALLYNNFFKKLEEQIEELNEKPEEESTEGKIFSDKIDPSLIDDNKF